MLFSNIVHCSMVEMASLAICSDIGGHGSRVYASSCHYQAFLHPGRNLQLSSTLVTLGGLPYRRAGAANCKSRSRPRLGLRRKGRMAAHMQNGLTHWNNSRMDSFTLMIMP